MPSVYKTIYVVCDCDGTPVGDEEQFNNYMFGDLGGAQLVCTELNEHALGFADPEEQGHPFSIETFVLASEVDAIKQERDTLLDWLSNANNMIKRMETWRTGAPSEPGVYPTRLQSLGRLYYGTARWQGDTWDDGGHHLTGRREYLPIRLDAEGDK